MNKTIQSQLLELGYTLKSTNSDSIKTAVKTKKKAKKVQQAKVEFKRHNIFDNKIKRKKKVKRKQCQFCGNRIKLTKFDEHVAKAHPENTTENIASRGYAIYPICKQCGVEVIGSMSTHQKNIYWLLQINHINLQDLNIKNQSLLLRKPLKCWKL
tara:strand:+ start:3077 stop:3541 length:465 start_codon:yes stop_codon:yes gene_type:complete